MDITHFVCSSVDGHLGCFHFLDTMNNAAMKFMYKVLCEHVLSFLLIMYLREEFLGPMETMFNSLGKC